MPIINLKVSGPEDPALAQELVRDRSPYKRFIKQKNRGYRSDSDIRF